MPMLKFNIEGNWQPDENSRGLHMSGNLPRNEFFMTMNATKTFIETEGFLGSNFVYLLAETVDDK